MGVRWLRSFSTPVPPSRWTVFTDTSVIPFRGYSECTLALCRESLRIYLIRWQS